jgi:hypothetical protein
MWKSWLNRHFDKANTSERFPNGFVEVLGSICKGTSSVQLIASFNAFDNNTEDSYPVEQMLDSAISHWGSDLSETTVIDEKGDKRPFNFGDITQEHLHLLARLCWLTRSDYEIKELLASAIGETALNSQSEAWTKESFVEHSKHTLAQIYNQTYPTLLTILLSDKGANPRKEKKKVDNNPRLPFAKRGRRERGSHTQPTQPHQSTQPTSTPAPTTTSVTEPTTLPFGNRGGRGGRGRGDRGGSQRKARNPNAPKYCNTTPTLTLGRNVLRILPTKVVEVVCFKL